MLVEDDKTMRSLLNTYLEIEGFEVVQVRDGEEGYSLENIMRILRRENPDLVLVDVNLKGVDGFDLLRCMRDDLNLIGIRVLMSSGMNFTYRCEQEGADGFILKPFVPNELITKIRGIIGD